MPLPKVKYTKQRGGYYHMNIPIPAAIRKEYGGKVAFEITTGSSDQKEAERQVTAQRAQFDIQIRTAQRRADQARLKSLLDPADAVTVEALGGQEHLSAALDSLRRQVAFLLASDGATLFPDDENLEPDAVREIQLRAEASAHQAFIDTITSEIRRLNRLLKKSGAAHGIGKTG